MTNKISETSELERHCFAKVREVLPPFKRHLTAATDRSGVHARVDIDTTDNDAHGSEVAS